MNMLAVRRHVLAPSLVCVALSFTAHAGDLQFNRNFSQLQGALAGLLGTQATAGAGTVPAPPPPAPNAPGKIRIGIAPAQAQLGQGNNAQSDYGPPIRNAIVYTMNGPAVEIAPLDAHIPIQLQAEAQQKQCDYILVSHVTVKHSNSNFDKYMRMGNAAANFNPMVGMTRSLGALATQAAAQAATQAAVMTAQQQVASQLSSFNGQIKSKDDVTVDYQLYPTGQAQPKLQSSLKGKAKSDGEDVLTPLIAQEATGVITEVTKK